MSKSFEESTGPLAERLIKALFAAQEAGGDIRGKQSACLLVVKGRSSGKVWEDRLIDLRVEDSSEPLKKLDRLLKVHRAYDHMNDIGRTSDVTFWRDGEKGFEELSYLIASE